MLTKIKTAVLSGIEGSVVTVETDVRRGLPAFNIVGLADTTIREACRRIRPAVANSGYRFPNEKITVNLVPAGIRKEGSHFDLPVAMGIIALELEKACFDDTAFLGEISLDGRINDIRGALPLAICLRRAGIRNIVIPGGNAEEVSILDDIDILPVSYLYQVVEHVCGRKIIRPYNKGKKNKETLPAEKDFSQVIGQETAKRAVTVAAAGNHGIMMIGGPGCGKTMIAERIPGIMPPLSYEEKLEITGIYSVAGLLGKDSLLRGERPFRAPHHTVSAAALTGGGARPRPGEISLAHRGVLFMDEFGEFSSRAIDAMRKPVEDGYVRISRVLDEVVFPARVMLVAASNPCRCGKLWDDKKICTCSARERDAYMRRLTGPFSDRIDMQIRMSPAARYEIEEGMDSGGSMSTSEMKAQVEAAALIQQERYRGTRYMNNGDLDEKGIHVFCRLDERCAGLMSEAYERLGLSMRACSRLLKVSRTIADLGGGGAVREEHIAEALMYRIADSDF